jgi:uncharacterized membrane protein YeaQ/YmgE (transglycosylase-associated protein family)
MPSLLGCLLIGVAIGLLCRTARISPQDEGRFFACAVAACGAVLGGLAAAPLLGFVGNEGAHFGVAPAVASIAGSIAVTLIARLLRTPVPFVPPNLYTS